MFVFISLFSLTLSAQDSTLVDARGIWLDNAIWRDGTGPGNDPILQDVHVFGDVVSGEGLVFSEGDLYVHDTLTIFGDLTLADTLQLTIDPGGLLIIRGNFTCGDTVDVFLSGQMVVTGEFQILGDNDQGSFDNDGILYVFDLTPTLKTGLGFEDFTCVNPVDSCTLYTEADLLSVPLGDFFQSGSFGISTTGSASICNGDSVHLAVTDTAMNYQWFLDDVAIPGAVSDELWAKAGGDFHVTFFIVGDSLVTEPVNVTVFPLPVVSVDGLAAGYCEGGDADTIAGNPLGGSFLAAAGFSILGGDSAIIDPVLAGSYSIQYYYTDGNGCTDTATVSTVVNPLPVVSVDGLAAGYCEGGDADTIAGNPLGGSFLAAAGFTILGGDSAIIDPVLAGSYSIQYYYTDGNGCTDTATVSTVVNPLPVVSFVGLDPEYCENFPQDTLTGSFGSGEFSGTGISDNGDGTAYFLPNVVGTHEIIYVYVDGNTCTDTARQSVTVHPLPAVSFTGLDPEYCAGESQDTLVGSQSGGSYSGTGISDNGDGTAYFNPTVPGTYDILYVYLNGNGCSDTASQSVTVHALPAVDFLGLPSDLCVEDPAQTLEGSHAPDGTFFGGTVADQGNGFGIFTPVTDGAFDVYYAYTDPNGCSDTAMHSVTVHPLPVVSIGVYDTIWDVNDPPFAIAGSPVGGTFTGNGISGMMYDPAMAGTGFDTVVYSYTDGNLCTNYDTLVFEIRDYDFKAGARYLWDIDNWCSPKPTTPPPEPPRMNPMRVAGHPDRTTIGGSCFRPPRPKFLWK
ncbi:MAG: hypothetical protein R2751_01550 [Bacteroidales bacterium]